MSIDPLLSPGWSHYFIAAPLSPKARVNLNRQLRTFSDRDRSFKPLASPALHVPLLDLGVVSQALEHRIISVLARFVPTCASLQIHSSGWALDFDDQLNPHGKSTSQSESKSGYLWLNWEDRIGVFSILRRELERELQDLCEDVQHVGPQAAVRGPQKKRDHFSVLCGSFYQYNSDTYHKTFRGSAWLNEICLQKRPQRFHPSNGYQSIWRHALPFETPELTDQDLDPVTSRTDQVPRLSSDQPLSGRALELFNLLEQRLEKNRQLPSTSKRSKTQRRRRRPRNKKHSS